MDTFDVRGDLEFIGKFLEIAKLNEIIYTNQVVDIVKKFLF